MAQIVVATSLAMELEGRSAERDWQVDTVEPSLPDLPFSDWGVRHWESLRLLLESLRDSLLRKDAAVHAGRHDPASVDASVDGRRARSKLFAEKYDKVMKYIKLQKDLCPLRKALRNSPDEEDSDCSTPSDEFMEPDLVKEFW
jgi:hypothetical protein